MQLSLDYLETVDRVIFKLVNVYYVPLALYKFIHRVLKFYVKLHLWTCNDNNKDYDNYDN